MHRLRSLVPFVSMWVTIAGCSSNGEDVSANPDDASDALRHRRDAGIDAASSCTPTTCAAVGASCGSIADGCGNTLDCGVCGATADAGSDASSAPLPPGVSIFVAQTAQGADNGSSCSDAHSAAWFNTASNWGTGAGLLRTGERAQGR